MYFKSAFVFISAFTLCCMLFSTVSKAQVNVQVIRPTYHPTNPVRPCYVPYPGGVLRQNPCVYPTSPPVRPTYQPCYVPYPDGILRQYPCAYPTNYPPVRPTYRPCYVLRPDGSTIAAPCNAPTFYPTRRPTFFPSRIPTSIPFPTNPPLPPQPTAFRTFTAVRTLPIPGTATPQRTPSPLRTGTPLRTATPGQTIIPDPTIPAGTLTPVQTRPDGTNTPEITNPAGTPTPVQTGNITTLPTNTPNADGTIITTAGVTYVMPYLNCVYNMNDGTYTAYFGYENFTGNFLTLPSGMSGNYISAAAPQVTGDPVLTDFHPGRRDGVYRVRFNGEPITWSVANDAKILSASASRDSAACTQVRPVTECWIAGSSSQTVFGYVNENPFPVYLPLNESNGFIPLSVYGNQPTTFYPGRVNNVFTTELNPSGTIYWNIGANQASSSTADPLCVGPDANQQTTNFPDTDLIITQAASDDSQPGCSQFSTAEVLMDSNQANTTLYNILLQSKDKRAIRKGSALLEKSRAELLKWPSSIINCADLERCTREDLQARNQAVINHTNELYSSIATALRKARKDSVTARRQLALARRINNSAADIIGQAPRFSSICR